MINRKGINQIYQEKYGTTWGLTDIQKCEFDYKECHTRDLIKLLLTLTRNDEWVFGGNNPTNKLNQIVYAIRVELTSRKNERETFSVERERPERNFNTIEYQEQSQSQQNGFVHHNNGFRQRRYSNQR